MQAVCWVRIRFDEGGEIKSQETIYEDGTGTITFKADCSGFTWHDDKSDREDVVFERTPEEDAGGAVG